jgi:hypothetical protein
MAPAIVPVAHGSAAKAFEKESTLSRLLGSGEQRFSTLDPLIAKRVPQAVLELRN